MKKIVLSDDAINKAFSSLSNGKSLQATANEHGVGKATLLRILTETPELLDQYRATLIAKAALHASEIVDIADDDSIPVDRAKLMVHARQWEASKILSKIFGDASQQPSQQVNIQATGDSRIVIQTASDVPNDTKESEEKSDSAIDV